MAKEEKESGIHIIQLNKYVKPVIKENISKNWVLNGDKNEYFDYVNDRNLGSPTNSAINNGYCRLMYGKGLAARDESKKLDQYARLKSILKPDDVERIICDFQVQGMAYFQIIRNKDKSLSSIEHVAVNKIAPEVQDEHGNINGYYFSNNWKKDYQEGNIPVRIPAFGSSKTFAPLEIYAIRPYQMGMDYFKLPDYQSAMQYAELEEEISNYSICHMKNGLSFGYIINIPNSYNLTPEKKKEVIKKMESKLTGSGNAGKFVINFADGSEGITVEALEINDAHKQWNFLSEEAQKKIITAHEVVSPMLFGIKDSNGFSSNADELDISERQTVKRVINPKQNKILRPIKEVLATDDITLDLYLKPLTEEVENVIEEKTTELSKHTCLSLDDNIASELILLGEDTPEGYEEIDVSPYSGQSLSEAQINTVIELARVPSSSPSNESVQDTSLFKIRYQYKGNKSPEREFCKKVIQANKVYTMDALKRASNIAVNKGFGAKGADVYDITLFKGGVNCKHFWERRIFLKENNNKISVNQARKMILALEPKDRAAATWDKNDKRVAQIADSSNNHWKLD